MRKLLLLMHCSLDGFVAGPEGEMDWINVDDELFDVVGKLTDGADAALYGRITYEMMQAYWPTAADQPNATKHDIEHSNWYNKVTKIVISTRLKEKADANTIIIHNNLAAGINRIKKETGGNILMIGSPGTAHAFMQEGLIDELWIYMNPVILGEGIPLFPRLNNRVPLTLEKSQKFKSGVIGLTYQLQKN